MKTNTRSRSAAMAQLLRLVLQAEGRAVDAPPQEPWARWRRLCPELHFRVERAGHAASWLAFGVLTPCGENEAEVQRTEWMALDSTVLQALHGRQPMSRDVDRRLSALADSVEANGLGDLLECLEHGRMLKVQHRAALSRKVENSRREAARVQVQARILYAGTTISMHRLPGFNSQAARTALGHESWNEAYVTLEFARTHRVHVDVREQVPGKRRYERPMAHASRKLRRAIIGNLEDEADCRIRYGLKYGLPRQVQAGKFWARQADAMRKFA